MLEDVGDAGALHLLALPGEERFEGGGVCREGLEGDFALGMIACEFGEALARAGDDFRSGSLAFSTPCIPAIGETDDVADVLGEEAVRDGIVAQASEEIDAADAEGLQGFGKIERCVARGDQRLVVADGAAGGHCGVGAKLYGEEAAGRAGIVAPDGDARLTAMARDEPSPVGREIGAGEFRVGGRKAAPCGDVAAGQRVRMKALDPH
jgi:hypothetical protein